MKTIKEKFEDKLYISFNDSLNKVYHKKLKYEGYRDLTHKLKVELREKCNEAFFRVSEELYWNKIRNK
jgi:hypothetical protein